MSNVTPITEGRADRIDNIARAVASGAGRSKEWHCEASAKLQAIAGEIRAIDEEEEG